MKSYDLPYEIGIDTPELWWSSIRFQKCHIRDLALRLFGITPSEASCEWNFSMLKWMIGDRRTRLNVKKLESISKIRSYYLTSIKNELLYYGKDLSSKELREIANISAVDEIIFLDNDNENNNDDDDNTNDLLSEKRKETETETNLILESIINLTKLFDNIETISSEDNNIDEGIGNMDFDPITLVNQVLETN